MAYRSPGDVAASPQAHEPSFPPALRDVKIEYAWGGTLARSPMKRSAFLARVAPNISLSASAIRPRRRNGDSTQASLDGTVQLKGRTAMA